MQCNFTDCNVKFCIRLLGLLGFESENADSDSDYTEFDPNFGRAQMKTNCLARLSKETTSQMYDFVKFWDDLGVIWGHSGVMKA